ncbi:putative cyclin-D6-1 [Abrus precatorius]|uniref:B-like cyclin n=1 Tax=Abrus precatorius TaxID=3816 RepID=A0A8B8KYD6_ABRPR|nr:putative cyclin-D6-1 [Abrus precatorius]
MEFDLEDPISCFKENQTCSISELFASESDYMPSPNHLSSADFHVSFRCEVSVIQVHFSCNLDPFVSYLAINYLDRFMSRQEIPRLQQENSWFLRVIVIACLSLASKMKNTPFSLSDFQKEGYIFDARSIQKMELLILGALEWRMRSITPFPFLHFFISVSKLNDPSVKQALKIRASEIILNTHSDIKFSEYKPSIIAASALISASHELFPLQYSTLRASVLACEYLDEEILSKCFNFIQELKIQANASVIDTSLRAQKQRI